jgi:hypothetical protein
MLHKVATFQGGCLRSRRFQLAGADHYVCRIKHVRNGQVGVVAQLLPLLA